MKACTCGYVFKENEKFCAVCGKSVEQSIEKTDTPTPLNVVRPLNAAPEVQQKPMAKPITTIFNNENMAKTEKTKQSRPRVVAKPVEKPMPGPNVIAEPVANTTAAKKHDPMRNPPPEDSKYAIMNQVTTAIHVFFMMIPVVGLVYSLLFTLGITKKHNTKVLATAFLTVYLVQIVLLAIAFLVLSVFFKQTFNEICGIIKYMWDTFCLLVK